MVQLSLYISFLIQRERLDFVEQACILMFSSANVGVVVAIFQEL